VARHHRSPWMMHFICQGAEDLLTTHIMFFFKNPDMWDIHATATIEQESSHNLQEGQLYLLLNPIWS
jgi:hypothetical protein